MRTELAALVLASIAVLAPPALAQEDDPMDRGRALYLEGLAAFDEGRLDEAHAAFREAYELTHVPAALHSVATTLRTMGRYADALTATRMLLTEHDDLDPEVRDTAAALERELRELIAIVTLLDVPPSPVLSVDGELRAVPDQRPVELELDPGHHRLRVEATDLVPFEWDGTLVAGERLRLDVILPAPAAPASDDTWIWIVASVAAVVVIGAAVGIGLGVHFGSQPSYDEHIPL